MMTDLKIRTEVFEAALKNPGPLAALIRSGDPLNERTRTALAMLIEGRLLLLEKRRGRSRKFGSWDDFIHSPHARAALLVEFEDLTHEQAAEKALQGEYRPGALKATKEQLINYLRTSESQRPKPPEPPEFFGVEHYIQWKFAEYQRKTLPK